MNTNERLLKVKDVASILGISQSSAYRLMQTVIPSVRFGRTVRVRAVDLFRFIELNLSIAPQEEHTMHQSTGCQFVKSDQQKQQSDWSR